MRRQVPAFSRIARVAGLRVPLRADRDPGALLLQPDERRPRSGRASRSSGTGSLVPQRAHPGVACATACRRGLATTADRHRRSGRSWRSALGRYEFRGKGATQSLLYLPIIIPEIVIGAALVTFFGVVGLRLSLTTVVIAHVVFSVSYVAIVVRARLSGFDRSLEEAALDLGARPLQTFWRVTLPADPAGDRGGRAPGLHGLDRRLRDHVVRRRRRRHDAAAPDLLDAEGGRHARGQRGLDTAARGDGRADRDRPAPPAAAAGDGRRRERGGARPRAARLVLVLCSRSSRRLPARAGRSRRTRGPARRSSTSTSGPSTSRRR